MLHKISELEVSNIESQPKIETFVLNSKEKLELLSSLGPDEFEQLNKGVSLKELMLEREILKKFGS